MTRKKNNNQNIKLKEFLDKSRDAKNLPLDEFEKEALQGFETLNSKEEAMQLKEDLDRRMDTEVFSEKSGSRYLYWAAAAGLILMLGISVYFVFNDNNITTGTRRLAVTVPETPKKEMEKTVVSRADERDYENQPENAVAPPSNSKKKEPTSEIATAETTTGKEVLSIARAKSTPVVPSEIPPVGDADKTDAFKTAADEQKNEALATNDAVVYEKNMQAGESAVIQSDDEKANKPTIERTKSLQSKKAPASVNRYAAPEAAPQTVEIAATSGAAVITSCSYIGGAVAFNKELKEKLEVKGIRKKFEGILFISEKGVVKKAELTKTFDLDKNEEKMVAEILKTMMNFNCPQAKKSEYKFVFQP